MGDCRHSTSLDLLRYTIVLPPLAHFVTPSILATGPDEPTSSHANKAPIGGDFPFATRQDTFATVPIHDELLQYQQQPFSVNSTLPSAVDITEDFGKLPILIRQHHITVALFKYGLDPQQLSKHGYHPPDFPISALPPSSIRRRHKPVCLLPLALQVSQPALPLSSKCHAFHHQSTRVSPSFFRHAPPWTSLIATAEGDFIYHTVCRQ